jgi:hypothetical protein
MKYLYIFSHKFYQQSLVAKSSVRLFIFAYFRTMFFSINCGDRN